MANQLGRYVWLVSPLRNHGRLTFDEIRQKWEDSGLCAGEPLSLRTFHNHRKAIADIFEVDIECDTHGGYKYYIENQEQFEGDTDDHSTCCGDHTPNMWDSRRTILYDASIQNNFTYFAVGLNQRPRTGYRRRTLPNYCELSEAAFQKTKPLINTDLMAQSNLTCSRLSSIFFFLLFFPSEVPIFLMVFNSTHRGT